VNAQSTAAHAEVIRAVSAARSHLHAVRKSVDTPAGSVTCSPELLRRAISELCCAIEHAIERNIERTCKRINQAAAVLRIELASESPDLTQDFGGLIQLTPAPRGLARWQIEKVTSYLQANLDRSLRTVELAQVMGLSSSHFCRAFKNALGIPPHSYLMRARVERAQALLLASDAPVADIAASCGFADQSHFTRLFKRFVGEAPRAWRRARESMPESEGRLSRGRSPISIKKEPLSALRIAPPNG
jgi:AraC family transcriptional regulator